MVYNTIIVNGWCTDLSKRPEIKKALLPEDCEEYQLELLMLAMHWGDDFEQIMREQLNIEPEHYNLYEDYIFDFIEHINIHYVQTR